MKDQDNFELKAEKRIIDALDEDNIDVEIALSFEDGTYSIDEEAETNLITAKFLEHLLARLGHGATKSFTLIGAIIEGKLHLTIWDIDFDVTFNYCQFKGGLIINDSKLLNLKLIGCITNQVFIDNSSIFGQFIFSGGGPKMPGICQGGLICEDVSFYGKVGIIEAKVIAQFEDEKYSQNVYSDACLGFTRCTVHSNLILKDIFGFGRFNCSYSQIRGRMLVDGCAINNFMRDTSLDTEFMMIEQGLSIKDSFLWGTLKLDLCKINGLTNIQGMFMPAVLKPNQEEENDGDYPQGLNKIHCFLSATNSEFDQILVHDSKMAGYLNFKNAYVRHDFAISACRIFDDSIPILTEYVDWFLDKFGIPLVQDLPINEGAQLIPSGFYLMFCKVDGVFRLNELSKSDEFFLDLDHSRMSIIADDRSSWPQNGFLSLNGLNYRGFLGDISLKERIEWLELQKDKVHRIEPYQQMVRFFKERGMQKEAISVAMKRVALHVKYERTSFLKKAVFLISKYTIGYGYQPQRSLVWIFSIIIVSAFVFNWGLFAIVPVSEGINLEEFNPVMFSIDSFLPIVEFGHSSNFRITTVGDPKFLSSALRIYYWFHITSGWILSTIAVIGFSGIIRKD